MKIFLFFWSWTLWCQLCVFAYIYEKVFTMHCLKNYVHIKYHGNYIKNEDENKNKTHTYNLSVNFVYKNYDVFEGLMMNLFQKFQLKFYFL